MRLGANIVIFLVLLAGIGVLQVYLSNKESKWPGLILPILSFVSSLIGVLGLYAYPLNQTALETAGQLLLLFLILSIPTAALLLIYVNCRAKRNRNRELNRMNIEDLK